MKIKIIFFGIFRDYLGFDIDLNISDKSNISDLQKKILKQVLKNDLSFLKNILMKSIFSDDKNVLSKDYILKENDIIYLLPPFSGG